MQNASITDEERRLIDEAVAAGKVQKIPQGKSALEVEYVWEGCKKHHGVGKLVMREPLSPKEVRQRWNGRYSAPRKTVPAIAKRREEVLRLSLEGYSAPQIAEYLSCDKMTIRNDRRYLQKKGELPKLSSSPLGIFAKDIESRREQVAKLYAQGISLRVMGEMFGVSKTAIQADIKILKEQGKIPQPDKIAAE